MSFFYPNKMAYAYPAVSADHNILQSMVVGKFGRYRLLQLA